MEKYTEATERIIKSFNHSEVYEKKDLAEGTFVEKWPDWLRWLLFLPGAIVAPALFTIFQRITTSLWVGDINNTLFEIVSDIIMGGGIVFVGALIAPRQQFFVAIILLVLVSSLGILSLMGGIDSHPLMALANFLFLVGAGVYTLYYIHQIETGETS